MTTSAFQQLLIGWSFSLLWLSGDVLAHDKSNARNSAECKQQVELLKNQSPQSLQAAYQECRSIDKDRQHSRHTLASSRLSEALERQSGKRAVPTQLIKEIFADQIAIRAFPSNDANRAVRNDIQEKFAKFAQQLKRENTQKSEPLPNWATHAEQCANIQGDIRSLQWEHRTALSQFLSPNKKSGGSGNGLAKTETSTQEFETQSRHRRDVIQQKRLQLSSLNCLTQDPVIASVPGKEADAASKASVEQLSQDLLPPLKGNLQTLGYYLSRPKGSTVNVVKDGQVLIYGAGLEGDHWESQAAQAKQVASYAQELSTKTRPLPTQLWNPQRRGWHHLSSPPECPSGEQSLHTGTELTTGKILFAGGICLRTSRIGLGSDSLAQTSVSIVDVKLQHWQKSYRLQQPRIYHTAHSMGDGSVLIIGGQSVGQTAKVLNSTERLNETATQKSPPLLQARAKHGSSIASDGRIYVTGGFDDQGRALNSAEVLDPSSQTWRAIPAMRVARYSHTSNLLADGRLIVIGGWGADGQSLSSVEIFDPQSGNWKQGPELPLAVHGHSATLLSNGHVFVAGGVWLDSAVKDIPWAWVWDAKGDHWETAARSPHINREDLATGFTLVPGNTGDVQIFSKKNMFRWTPSPAATAITPRWQLPPSVSPLADGRSLWIGVEFGNLGTKPPVSFIFDPKTQLWTPAGRLNRLTWSKESNLLLPSKEVMHVGMHTEAMQCEIWSPETQVWSDCGFARTEYPNSQPPALGLLADGRVIAIANRQESFVYDAKTKHWTLWHSLWNPEVIQYGIVIRSVKPLFQVYDEDKKLWAALNAAGTSYWMNSTGTDDVRLLWDDTTKSWSYMFGSNKEIGRNAQFLPNGCALSTQPLAIFDPSTGTTSLIEDSTLADIPPFGTLHVFKNGLFAVVDQEVREENKAGSFFFGQADCKGIVRVSPDRSTYPANLLKEFEEKPPVNTKPEKAIEKLPVEKNRPPKETQPQPRLALPSAYGPFALDILVFSVLYLMFRRPSRHTSNHNLSKWFHRFVFTLFVLYAFFAISTRIGSPFFQASHSCGSMFGSCVDSKSGILKNTSAGPSTIPCEVIGIWNYRKDGIKRRIEFKDNGRYTMESLPGSYDSGKVYTGHWARQGRTFAWWHEQGSTEMEFNGIQFFEPEQFVLVEQNGAITSFELVRSIDSKQCHP